MQNLSVIGINNTSTIPGEKCLFYKSHQPRIKLALSSLPIMVH